MTINVRYIITFHHLSASLVVDSMISLRKQPSVQEMLEEYDQYEILAILSKLLR